MRKTRCPKPDARNQTHETRRAISRCGTADAQNQMPKTRRTKPEARNQTHETRSVISRCGAAGAQNQMRNTRNSFLRFAKGIIKVSTGRVNKKMWKNSDFFSSHRPSPPCRRHKSRRSQEKQTHHPFSLPCRNSQLLRHCPGPGAPGAPRLHSIAAIIGRCASAPLPDGEGGDFPPPVRGHHRMDSEACYSAK